MRIQCFNCRQLTSENTLEPFDYLVRVQDGSHRVVSRRTCRSCIEQIYMEAPEGWTKCLRCKRLTLEEPRNRNRVKTILQTEFKILNGQVESQEYTGVGKGVFCERCFLEDNRRQTGLG